MSFKLNLFDETKSPAIILSTKYHKHLGTIENIDTAGINAGFNMASAQELSFDVYKEMDGKTCSLWDFIVDFKYIFVPEFQEYYEIKISLDEDNKTIKHVTATSACEAELSTRLLRNFECNSEADILRDDYEPTVLYNPNKPEASLLDRVLKDKCPDYTIAHVDASIASMQRTFSADNEDIYTFFTSTVAEELECLFVFDSVNRAISVYDLKNACQECGHRFDTGNICPKCGSENLSQKYGENTSVYISADNYAELITVEGNTDNVFNCFKIEGGDDLITATVANINPNGSNYIYQYQQDALEDMPENLVNKINEYNTLYNNKKPAYTEYTEKMYEAIDKELNLTSEMMPEIAIPTTSAQQELFNLLTQLSEVAVANISVLSKASSDIAVKGMAKVIVDARYDVEIISSSLSGLTDDTYRTWTGKFKIMNKGNEEDIAESTSLTSVKISSNHEEYLYQKIQKTLDKEDFTFYSIFEIEDIQVFKTELEKYCLDRLKSFESSYQTCLEVLIDNGVPDVNSVFYDVDLYNSMYVPYHERILVIQNEMVNRETQISEVQAEKEAYDKLRKDIQKELNFKDYLGDDLWLILSHYLKEDTYSNGNYISKGLNNAELIKKASELYSIACNELYAASRLQFNLTSNLLNLLNAKEFAPFKDKIELGNWINVRADEALYQLRLISLSVDYGNLKNISVTFSNAVKVDTVISDTQSILNQAKSMAVSYDYVAHQASQGNEAGNTVNSWFNNGLDASAVAISSGKNQEITYDEHGLTCRHYDDFLDDYSPEQLKIINNMLAITDNNWETVKAAIGSIYYQDPENGVMKSAYGVIADVLVGKVILGEALGIYNNGGNLKFTENGLEITNGINTFKVNPNNHQKLFSISNQNEDILYVDSKGNGVFKGKIYATSGEFTGDIKSSNIIGTEINNGNGTFKVTKDGKVTATNGEFTGDIKAISLSVENNGVYEDFNKNLFEYKNILDLNTSSILLSNDSTTYGNTSISLVPMHGIYLNAIKNKGQGMSGFTQIHISNQVEYNPSMQMIFSDTNGQKHIYFGSDEAFFDSDLRIHGNFIVSDGTKSKVISTKNYGNRLLYCYEMPSPMFGDIGHAIIGRDGLCYIDLESIFEETIASYVQYYVFLQSYNEKQPYVLEKFSTYFVVTGEPDTEFDWEVKAKQKDYTFERLEETSDNSLNTTDINYEFLAEEYLNNYEKEIINEHN